MEPYMHIYTFVHHGQEKHLQNDVRQLNLHILKGKENVLLY